MVTRSTNCGPEFKLVSLCVLLETHQEKHLEVVWIQQRTDFSREEAYAGTSQPMEPFSEDRKRDLRDGNRYDFTSAAGKDVTGTCFLPVQTRGYCFSVTELDDALLWLTIEGSPGSMAAQLWHSACGWAEQKLGAFGNE